MKTRRRSGASFLAVCAGIAIRLGSLLPWVAARQRRPASGIRHTSVADLFHWHYVNVAPFIRSFGVVVLASGILVLIGGLLGSRLLVGVFSALSLVALGLWIGVNASHYNPIDLPYSDLRIGAWLTLAGGLAGLISAFFLRRRTRRTVPAAA